MSEYPYSWIFNAETNPMFSLWWFIARFPGFRLSYRLDSTRMLYLIMLDWIWVFRSFFGIELILAHVCTLESWKSLKTHEVLLWHCDLRFSCVPQHAPKHDGLSRRWQSSSKSPLHHSTLIPGTIFGRCLMFLLKLLGHVRFKKKV